jgi:hypothetical protein
MKMPPTTSGRILAGAIAIGTLEGGPHCFPCNTGLSVLYSRNRRRAVPEDSIMTVLLITALRAAETLARFHMEQAANVPAGLIQNRHRDMARKCLADADGSPQDRRRRGDRRAPGRGDAPARPGDCAADHRPPPDHARPGAAGRRGAGGPSCNGAGYRGRTRRGAGAGGGPRAGFVTAPV